MTLLLEGFVREHLMFLQPKYLTELVFPPDPEPSSLLGNRWADYGLCLGWALLFPILRSVLKRYVYEPAGKAIIFGKHSKIVAQAVKVERLRKWNESAWKMTVFLIFTLTALYVSIGEPWFWDSRYYWAGCSHFPPCNLEVSRGVLLFYTLETGFYLQSIHFLIFHEVRRQDWLESMIHHVATSMLLLYSYWVNFARVGVMIMLVHDMSDIFLEAAKLARYARKQKAALILFVVFTVVWIVTRNVIFPLYIIRSTLLESLHYADVNSIHPEPHYTIFNALLILLEILHIYWTWLILKVIAKQLMEGNTRDIREKDEDSDDD